MFCLQLRHNLFTHISSSLENESSFLWWRVNELSFSSELVLLGTTCSKQVPYILIPETNKFYELSVLPDEDELLRLKVSLASLTLRRSGPDTLAEVDLAVDCSVFSWVFIVALFWLGPGGEGRTALLSSAWKLNGQKQNRRIKENRIREQRDQAYRVDPWLERAESWCWDFFLNLWLRRSFKLLLTAVL